MPSHEPLVASQPCQDGHFDRAALCHLEQRAPVEPLARSRVGEGRLLHLQPPRRVLVAREARRLLGRAEDATAAVASRARREELRQLEVERLERLVLLHHLDRHAAARGCCTSTSTASACHSSQLLEPLLELGVGAALLLELPEQLRVALLQRSVPLVERVGVVRRRLWCGELDGRGLPGVVQRVARVGGEMGGEMR